MRIAAASLLVGLLIGVPVVMTSQPGEAARGYLGVALVDAPSGAPAAAMVVRIDSTGPAAQAGLRLGDLIRSVNGHATSDAHALQAYVFSQHPGAVLAMDVLRRTSSGFSPTRVTVTLGSGPGGNPPAAAGPGGRVASPPAPTAAPPEPPVAGGGEGNVRYVSYTDPVERSFTVLSPAGWRVGGRMVRYGPISIAPFVQAMTPDGTIFVQLGDWHIKDYCDIPGWREGQLYTPGTSVEFIRRVQSAEQYGHAYSLIFQKELGCGNPDFTGSQNLPNPPGVTPAIQQARVETSLTQFTCQRSGRSYSGRVIASVQSYRLPNMSVGWNIVYLASVLALQNRAGAGFAVFDKMRGSFAFDSNWNARQAMMARRATQPSVDALNATLRQAQDFDQHVINGLVTVDDSTTGVRSDINIGVAPFYFKDGMGHSYNSYDPTPRPGYHGVNPVNAGQ